MRLVMNLLKAALAASLVVLAACGSNDTANSPSSAGGSTAMTAVIHAASTTGAASPNGTAIPTATQIIDGSGNVWTVAGGVAYENGAAAGNSSNVTLLLYDNDTLYQENSDGTWYTWNDGAWYPVSGDPRTTPSPNGTTVPAATQITDGNDNVWAIAGGVVYENGAFADKSSEVVLLLYDNNALYHQNKDGNWYSWNGSAWIPGSDPRSTPSPNGTTVATPNLTGSGNDIVSVRSGQCATVNADSTSAGTPIVQWPCGGVSEQTWSLQAIGNYYHIVSVGSGLCLNISNGSTAAGDPIIQWPCQTSSATNDQWSIVAVGASNEIVSALDGQCLTIDGDSQSQGAQLVQEACASDQSDDLWSLAAPSEPGSAQVQITDGGGNVWAVAGGVIYENGSAAGDSSNVTLLLYDNNNLFQENAAGTWYSWNGSTWIPGADPRATPSPNGTSVPASPQITDSSGNVWTIGGAVVYENGALAGYSENVTELVYQSGTIYQETSAGNWYTWNGSTWVAGNAPGNLGSATLSWDAPTENTNGTPLTDLAGYTIYYGSSPGSLTQTISVADASATSYVVDNLSSGSYYFAVAADATDGTQSAQSSVGSKTIP